MTFTDALAPLRLSVIKTLVRFAWGRYPPLGGLILAALGELGQGMRERLGRVFAKLHTIARPSAFSPLAQPRCASIGPR